MNPYRPSNPSESEASPHQTMNVETENQEKSVPDPRVVAALDDLGYEYEFKADSTRFNVSFNMDEGRSQCVFISSATHEFLGVEFRSISSIGLVSEGIFDVRTANLLLRENARTNLGYWCIETNEKNCHYALFCMRVSAVLSHRALGELLVMIAENADQTEKRLSGLDEF